MKLQTKQLLDQAIDRYTEDSELNGLLKQFAERKVEEQSIWGQMTLVTHEMFGGRFPYIEETAAVAELLLLSLDIVDDLQDSDNPSMPWMQAGHAVALNAVLSLVFASIGELSRIHAAGVAEGCSMSLDLQQVSRMIQQSVLGQQLDITNAVHSEQDYIAMIRSKSGTLLKLVCYLGYSTAGEHDPAAIEQMNEMAETLGIMSQLRNDSRDVVRWDLKNDLLQKKRTLPVLYMLADEEDPLQPLVDYYEGTITQDEFLLHKVACIEYIEQSGCLEYAAIIESLFRDRAEALLEELHVEPAAKERFRALLLPPRH